VCMASIRKTFKEINDEIKKVRWPKKEEITNATLLVAIISIFVSIYIGVFDLVFSRFIDKLSTIFGG
jgi:preprotein translocase subunit SecE